MFKLHYFVGRCFSLNMVVAFFYTYLIYALTIASLTGDRGCQSINNDKLLMFRTSYKNLKNNINTVLWNEEVNSYSSFNLLTGKFQFSFSDPYLKSSIGKDSFQSCSNLIPLYARLASREQAVFPAPANIITMRYGEIRRDLWIPIA